MLLHMPAAIGLAIAIAESFMLFAIEADNAIVRLL